MNASSGCISLDLRVDHEPRQGGVAPGNSATCVEADPGKAFTLHSAGANRALLRLVNGVVGLAGNLSMSADFTPVADNVNVAPGGASVHDLVDATTTGRLSVTAAGVAQPLVHLNEQTFSAAANCTVFLVGSPAAPVGIVRKDR